MSIIENLNSIKVTDLLNQELPKPYYAVEEMFSEGGNIIAAPRNTGKSWMALDLCIAVCHGEIFFGFQTNRASVLYIGMEEGAISMQDRLRKTLNGRSVPDNLKIAFEDICTMQNGFLDQMEQIVEENPEIRMIVIDPGNWIMGTWKKNGTLDHSMDDEYYEQLTRFGQEHHIAMVTVVHTSKPSNPDDPLDGVRKVKGLIHSVDNIVTLEKKPDGTAILYKEGKHIPRREYAIRFDPVACRWEMMDPEDDNWLQDQKDYQNSAIRATICKKLEERSSIMCKANDILNWSKEYGCPISCSGKEVGTFIRANQPEFLSDNIRIQLLKNAAGWHEYLFVKEEKKKK